MNDSDNLNIDVGKALKSEKFDGVRISIVGLALVVVAIPLYFVLKLVGQIVLIIGILIGVFGFGVHIVRVLGKSDDQ